MNCPCLVSIKVHCLMSFLFSPFQSPSNPSTHTLSTLHTTFLYLSTTVYFFLNDPTKLITICVLFSCVLSLSLSLSLSSQYSQILLATYFHTHTLTTAALELFGTHQAHTHTHSLPYSEIPNARPFHVYYQIRILFLALLQLSL